VRPEASFTRRPPESGTGSSRVSSIAPSDTDQAIRVYQQRLVDDLFNGLEDSSLNKSPKKSCESASLLLINRGIAVEKRVTAKQRQQSVNAKAQLEHLWDDATREAAASKYPTILKVEQVNPRAA
jgi:hypothetical protein